VEVVEVEGGGGGQRCEGGSGGEGAPKSALIADAASCEAAACRAVPAAVVTQDCLQIAPATRTSIRLSRRRLASLSCASLIAARAARDAG